jgi:7,8-dihydropterin-6-yl-methyl-4-(beta-D-ribofuranosyl)aminobenzene 5'-phosphate synthase
MQFIFLVLVALLIACNGQISPSDNAQDGGQAFAEIPENTILNMYDAFGDHHAGLQKDFGFSCLINYQGTIILFDAGTNADIFRNNTAALGIDLTQIDFVVVSHAHFDHINGLDYLLEVHPEIKIYFPFDPFWGANIPFDLKGMDPSVEDSLEKRMLYFEGEYQSFTFKQSGRFWNANVEFVREDREIAPGIQLVTTSSPYLGYFSRYPNLNIDVTGAGMQEDQAGEAHFIQLPELSLSLETDAGEVVIVGCSHSTVESIVRKTKDVTERNIHLVYGGYHLLPYEAGELKQLARILRDDLGVQQVAPAHCTGHLAFKVLKDTFGEAYQFAGLGERISF